MNLHRHHYSGEESQHVWYKQLWYQPTAKVTGNGKIHPPPFAKIAEPILRLEISNYLPIHKI